MSQPAPNRSSKASTVDATTARVRFTSPRFRGDVVFFCSRAAEIGRIVNEIMKSAR